MKIASFSVHKNKRDQRRRRETTRCLISDVKSVTERKDIDGFVLVTWDKNTEARCSWSLGGVPQRALPDFVRGVLQSKFSMDDAHSIIWGDDDDAG